MRRHALLACLLALVLIAPSAAAVRFGAPVAGNPADEMTGVPIEDFTYDPATRCSRTRRPGVAAFQEWLETTRSRGASWGSYRCERWGRGVASLHAEGRALDWHLDVTVPADRREADALIRLLLAPDAAGNPQALARRMGVQEIIWDCGYWSAGLEEFKGYAPCENRHGRPRRKVDPTVAHRNHVHFGFTKAGAMGRTSYWRH